MSETIKPGSEVYLLLEHKRHRVRVKSVHADPPALTVILGDGDWIVYRSEVMTTGERRTMLKERRMSKLRKKYADLLAAHTPGDTFRDIAVKLGWLPMVAFNKLEACRRAGLLP